MLPTVHNSSVDSEGSAHDPDTPRDTAERLVCASDY